MNPLKYLLLLFSFLSIGTFVHAQEFQLVWSDEFNYSGKPDQEKWRTITGDGCPEVCGWGNNELQYYTDENANLRVEDGKLIIEAHQEQINNSNYSSAKIRSVASDAWKYGRIEVSAKLPEGKGTWPAIWMLPELDRPMQWPLDGEIDIMEHVGYNQGMIVGSIHTEKYNHKKGTEKNDSLFVENAGSNFNTYSIEWTPEHIKWFVNDSLYSTQYKGEELKEGWPFDQEFHLILNLAVGGDWGGRRGIDDKIWPQQMQIDYVRVYQSL